MAKKEKKEKKSRALVPVDVDQIAVQAFKQSKFKAKPTEQVIESVIDELEALLVQRGKAAREDVMMMSWDAGKMLREAEKANKVSISALVSRVALDNRISGRHFGERTLWFAIKFYDTYPKFESVYETEHGENISFSKIKKMLITPKPKHSKSLQEIAYDIVDKLGADEAQRLIQEIEAEIKRREKQGA